ncbi:serine/threonine protein kinase, partial [Plasmodium falciparum Vietnam Oak-Knoll (FVO)]
ENITEENITEENVTEENEDKNSDDKNVEERNCRASAHGRRFIQTRSRYKQLYNEKHRINKNMHNKQINKMSQINNRNRNMNNMDEEKKSSTDICDHSREMENDENEENVELDNIKELNGIINKENIENDENIKPDMKKNKEKVNVITNERNKRKREKTKCTDEKNDQGKDNTHEHMVEKKVKLEEDSEEMERNTNNNKINYDKNNNDEKNNNTDCTNCTYCEDNIKENNIIFLNGNVENIDNDKNKLVSETVECTNDINEKKKIGEQIACTNNDKMLYSVNVINDDFNMKNVVEFLSHNDVAIKKELNYLNIENKIHEREYILDNKKTLHIDNKKNKDIYYNIAKSGIDENMINSNLFDNYDNKNNVRDLPRDLYSSTDGTMDIIINKKKKIWLNIGCINYMDNFVGKGSYGSVRKVLYNIDLNNEYLKFYMDKINDVKFLKVLTHTCHMKKGLKYLVDKYDIASDSDCVSYWNDYYLELKDHVDDEKYEEITKETKNVQKVQDEKNKDNEKSINKNTNKLNEKELVILESDLMLNNKLDNCLCCHKKRYFELAVKEIDISRKGNEFQFLREQELLCHFNCNVIKPLSTKIGHLKDKQNYEILMHCATGDLRKLLQNLLYHRKKEYEKKKKVNKILKLIHILFGRKYHCFESLYNFECIGLCYKKLKNMKMKINNNTIEIKNPEFDYIYENVKEYNCGLTESECKFLFFQIASGISFIQTCYQSNIVRLTDIKLQNILVFTDSYNIYNPLKWHLCISDFGCSAMEYATYYLENSKNFMNVYKTLLNQWKYEFKNQLSSYFQGTVYTMAPEGLCYDHNGNYRQSKYNQLIYFYEQNFGDIEKRFEELQKPPISIKHTMHNLKVLNINCNVNFTFLNNHLQKYNNEQDEKTIQESTDTIKKEKNTLTCKKINMDNETNGTNYKNYKNKNNMSENLNIPSESSSTNNSSTNNYNNSNNTSASTQYSPFDIRCDSWSLGIILADLAKCGVNSYEYMIMDNYREEDNLFNEKMEILNNIILKDLNVLEDDEMFYIKYIMDYYDIVSLQWGDEIIQNERIKHNVHMHKKIDTNESKNKNNNNEINRDNAYNIYDKHKKNHADNNNNNNIIISTNTDETNKENKKVHVKSCNKKTPHNSDMCPNNIRSSSNTVGMVFNKNEIYLNSLKKDDEKVHVENSESFTQHYKSLILKYKKYIKNDKFIQIKNEYVHYYKIYKKYLNEENMRRYLLLALLLMNNNISYKRCNEIQSFAKVELTIKNIGSGIFKFRNKKEKENYIKEFKMNVQNDMMNPNKDYWHSRLTNKYLACILKDICHDDFYNRMKKIKKSFNKYELPLNYSDEYWDLLTNLLNYVPSERLLACEVLGHDFFSEHNEKIHNIIKENNHERYVELFKDETFCDTLLKNYKQEKKEKNYISRPFFQDLRKKLDGVYKEDQKKNIQSDYKLKLKKCSIPLEIIRNKIILNKQNSEEKCHNNDNCYIIDTTNNSNINNNNNNNNNCSNNVLRHNKKSDIFNKNIVNQINNNKTIKYIILMYEIIIKNMKKKCGMCNDIKNCLNYKHIINKIKNLENLILNFQLSKKNIICDHKKKIKIPMLYLSNVCNNIYYFLNDYSIFEEFKNLDIFMNIHLPFEHLSLPLCDEKTFRNKNFANFYFKPIYYYSLPYKIIHAWYTGPAHIYFNHPYIPDFIKLICLREKNVLRRKEIIFWYDEDIVLNNILKIKDILKCSNDFLCTPYVSHLIGKQLILRKYFITKFFNDKMKLYIDN